MAGAVLHWDLENAPVPRGVSVSLVLGAMRAAIHERFGPMYAGYAYADPSALTTARKTELVASGLDLIDCSRQAGKHNCVDFRIISRSLAELSRPSGPSGRSTAVVVVTGDGDYAYSLGRLRNLGVDTMLIFDSDRREAVNPLMLQVAGYTVAISFTGDGEGAVDATDEASVAGLSGAVAGESSGASASVEPAPAPLDQNQRMFMQALRCAEEAREGGVKLGTQVGCLFHRLRNVPHETPNERRAMFRATRRQLIEKGLLDPTVEGEHIRASAA